MLHEPPPELKLEVVIEEARDHHATKDQNSFSSIGEQARKAAIRTTQLGEPAQVTAGTGKQSLLKSVVVLTGLYMVGQFCLSDPFS